MLKLVLLGYGAMGKIVKEAAEQYGDVEIAAVCDPVAEGAAKTLDEITEDFDVIIDFSAADTIYNTAEYCKTHKKPAVLAVTGYTAGQEEIIVKLAESVPVFRTKNLSVGINVAEKLVTEAAERLGDFDIEIIEKHHRDKKDMPSGTAQMLAEAAKRDVPIHSLRLGTVAGEHTVIFAGRDEIVEIKHTALSKKVFAEGAVKAARFLKNAAPGLYNMADIL